MKSDDAREVLRLAQDLEAITEPFGGVEAIRELEIEQFRRQLDGDDEGASQVLSRVRALASHQEAAGELLRAFCRALERNNMPLAYAAHAGILDLVQRAVAAELTTTGEEDEDDGADDDESREA